MKKLLAIFLSALLLCTMIPFATVSADYEEPTIVAVPSTDVVNAGDEVEVAVMLLNNPGVIAKVKVLYDESVMELCTYYDEDEEDYFNMIEVGSGYNASSNKYITFAPLGNCLVNFVRGTAKTPVTNELFFTATFKISKDDAVSGTYPLTLEVNPADFFTLGEEEVAFDVAVGSITVNGTDPEPVCEHEYFSDCDTVCLICGEESRPEAGHNVVHTPAKDATCTELGNIEYWYCSVCGMAWLNEACTRNTNLRAVVLPMIDHAYDNACDPHCNECGGLRDVEHQWADIVCGTPKTCAICGITEGEAIEHNWVDATCTDPKTCTICGETEGAKLGHTYKKEVVSKATLTKNGSYKNVCTVCGYVASKQPTIYKASQISLSKTSYTYNGKVQQPTVIVKDSNGNTISSSNYTVTYASGCKNAGTYKVTVKMKGNYSGTKELTYKINGISISKCTVTLSKTSFTYTGKVQKPTVTVKNANGTKLSTTSHYTVTYASGLKNVGEYKVTIKMKGNYTGTKTLTYKIIPVNTSISKLTAGSKKLTVSWSKKTTQVTGYQIQYSTAKSFSSYKTKAISSYKTTSTSLTGLKAKTTYYVRVRTYKVVNGKKVYGAWSTVKSLKTK